MIIAQITDVHIGFDQGNPDEINRQRLAQTLSELCETHNRPDFMLATGDLTDHGDLPSYEALRASFDGLPFPVWPCMGNHDLRDNFLTVFPEIPSADGFIQYEVDLGTVRLLILDTLEEGRHGGAFCATRAAWLAAALAADPDRPTIIVMHHPPLPVGIDWMDPIADEPWIQRFREAMAGHNQVVAILCGHLHRPVVAPWHGSTLAICPATAVQLALDLRPIDPQVPDGRAMITLDPAAYALHKLDGTQLVTHFATVREERVLVRYDEKMQPLVEELMSEHKH